MITNNIFQGITGDDFSAIVNQQNLNDYYFPTLFPLNETYNLSWKVLESSGAFRVAADVVARGATVQPKSHDVINRIDGDIPKLLVTKIREEGDLTDLSLLRAISKGNGALEATVRAISDDVSFCWNAIASRIEWMALQSISKGRIRLDETNNNGVTSRVDIDYQLGANQRLGAKTSYDAYNGNPLTYDIPNVLRQARANLGANYKYLFMNADTFAKFAMQEEVKKATTSVIHSLNGYHDAPSKEALNAYLKTQAERFHGLQIVVIDQQIQMEQPDGSRITANPFEDDVMLFSESNVLGKTFYKKPIEMELTHSNDYRTMRGATMIQQFDEHRPTRAITEGVANAFPAWERANRSTLMQVNNTSWNKDKE